MSAAPSNAAGGKPIKRSLILAGGGLKVAFQAGVMQVWLDEARLKFDHADGASGGCFNLAMMCQGMSGRQIADNWRTLNPAAGVSVNWVQFERLFFARSLFTLDAYRAKVFPGWGLDWQRIRASALDATFNVYNFSGHQLRVLPPAEMDEDRLCACVSLPMWFPPIVLDGDTHIDAVYITDANLEEAIRRGADEIWVIWTVSTRGEWDDGFVNNYFQIIETSANGRFNQIRQRIQANNDAIAAGKAGEFGRPIALKVLQAEVALNYLINFSADRVAEAVNQGVQTARQWCRDNGVPFNPLPDPVAVSPARALTSLKFTEEMKGYIMPGETDFDRGLRAGRQAGNETTAHLTIRADNVDRFITDPHHEAAVTGYVECNALGGRRTVQQGVFNLLVDNQDFDRKAMYYRLFFTDGQNRPLTLFGFKDVHSDDHSDVWTDTTTLFTRVYDGFVQQQDESKAKIVASGIIRIHMLDFLHELTTFRVEGGSAADRASALSRFGTMFLGKLWDVYARHVLPVSPV